MNGPGGYLLLEDGARFNGDALLGGDEVFGEAVFNTSHTGYQEILSDPSYRGQILIFTAPHIGNVGVNEGDRESAGVQASGAVVRSLASRPGNWRAERDLAGWMEEAGAPLLAGADTRAVTLHLRSRGAMRAGLFSAAVDEGDALERVRASRSMIGADLAGEAGCAEPYTLRPGEVDPAWHTITGDGEGLRVAVLDFGVKRNILRELAGRGCEVTVHPARTGPGEILSGGYDGVLLSNGPGDPSAVTYGVETARGLLEGGIPLFGICLGHQLLSLAAGLETFKLPFGHRGANHPVRRETDGIIEITSQNHGFAVKAEGLGADWRITHINLNDRTVEGLAHAGLPVFSLQYHPEASPGPHDSLGYFDRFIDLMRAGGG